MPPDFDPTPEQQAIIDHDVGQHARVLAGPGTGKSATVVAFLDRLLGGEQPPRLRLLTFTRAATAELAKKVSEHPAVVAERPSTIHSFAISVLLQNPGAAGLPEPLRIADDWERENLIIPTLSRLAHVRVRRLRRLIREMAASWESLAPDIDPVVDEAERNRFVGAWDQHRRIYGYTLPSELPYAVRQALRDHPDLAGIDYDALIVDEYKDLNACDLSVIRLTSERGCSVIAAGDDDQSIYKFRKAAPEGIRRFIDDYPGAADYPLSVSRRCARSIIAWARYVIEADPGREERPPLTPADDAPEGEVALLAFGGHVSEAQGIARLVQKLIDNQEIPASEILVLLRTDYNGMFSSIIKPQLERLGIAYSDPDAVKRMLAEPSHRRMLEMFRLLVRRDDSLAWASLFRLAVGVGDAFIDYVYERARERPARFGEVLLEAHAAGFPDAPTAPANAASAVIDQALAWLEEHEPPEGDDVAWGAWMLEVSGGEVTPAPSEALAELLLVLDDLAEPGQELERYLGQIIPLGEDLERAESAGVRIMTMASAKGLTVRATIIAALEDQVIPRPDVDPSEERRLLYVAMTRSTDVVYGTWARRRTGPTARAGRGRTVERRSYSSFLRDGPVDSQDGDAFIQERWAEN
jgi:ATP-dependent DNA helicase UvrD/PcrA